MNKKTPCSNVVAGVEEIKLVIKLLLTTFVSLNIVMIIVVIQSV